jgi:hypothetical protein
VAIVTTVCWDEVFAALPTWFIRDGALRKGDDDADYPCNAYSFRFRADAFIEAFYSSEKPRKQSISFVKRLLAERVKGSNSTAELDVVIKIITDLATEIYRWPTRKMEATGNSCEDEANSWLQRRNRMLRWVKKQYAVRYKRLEAPGMMYKCCTHLKRDGDAGKPKFLVTLNGV